MAKIAAVFHLQIEAGGIAQFGHRRRHDGKDLGVAASGQDAKKARCGDRRGGILARPGASFQSFSWTKAMPVFWPAPASLKPATAKTNVDLSFSAVAIIFCDLVGHRERVRCNCVPGGRVIRLKMKPWSSSGRKPVGRSTERSASTSHDHRHRPAWWAAVIQEPIPDGLADTSARKFSKSRLNQSKKRPSRPPAWAWPPFSIGLSKVAHKRRRQHQRHHDRQQHGRDDGDGELAVDHAGRAAEEGHGQEHRGQHQADADQGAGDFLHRRKVASRGGSPSSRMMRSTFSTTTMASSTRRPITSTSANRVSD